MKRTNDGCVHVCIRTYSRFQKYWRVLTDTKSTNFERTQGAEHLDLGHLVIATNLMLSRSGHCLDVVLSDIPILLKATVSRTRTQILLWLWQSDCLTMCWRRMTKETNIKPMYVWFIYLHIFEPIEILLSGSKIMNCLRIRFRLHNCRFPIIISSLRGYCISRFRFFSASFSSNEFMCLFFLSPTAIYFLRRPANVNQLCFIFCVCRAQYVHVDHVCQIAKCFLCVESLLDGT